MRRPLLVSTSLDIAVLLYLGLILVRFFVDRSGMVGWWGLYMSVMYLPLFLLVPAVLRELPSGWVRKVLGLIVLTGTLAALGGLVEFIFNVTLWPSQEAIQRQGFAEVFIYGTHLRRVYFVFDSPTTLANTLAMLLPLAVVLGFSSQDNKGRIFWAISAILLAACIVVTFSRGIWVAVVLTFIAMLILAFFAFRPPIPFATPHLVYKRAVIAIVPVVVLVGTVTAAALVNSSSESRNSANALVVELPPQEYQSVPSTGHKQSLLEMDPLLGDIEIQEWLLFDPILQVNDYRAVIYEHPPESGKTEIIYQADIPENGSLRFAIALSPDVWSPEKGDGVEFQVYIAPAESPEMGDFAFVRYINPKMNPSDRRWRNFLVDLSPWEGRTANISLITECGAAGNCAFDWAGWADMELGSIAPAYFDQYPGVDNLLLQHLRSITDWQRDETNRDRLAAWNTGLSAWRSSPMWGIGLGRTGAAALRTHPETAFVTESQVLKSLTELGLPGLFVFGFLWFSIGKTGFTLFSKTQDRNRRILLLGIMASLLVVFIEGVVYQNLEVKQVNAGFWTLVGVLIYFRGRVDD